jgi:hypothetical protein
MDDHSPARPWAIWVDDELYGDFKTEAERDKALPKAREYARETGGQVLLQDWEPPGHYDREQATYRAYGHWPQPRPDPERHREQQPAGIADQPGDSHHHIHARDVRPGMVVWNPYGGARGQAEVASEPRRRPDGAIEFDTTDGRTGVFRPHFRLHFDRSATERLAAERAAQHPATGSWAQSQTGPERFESGTTGDSSHALTVTPRGPASEPRAGEAAAWATQAVIDRIHSGRLRAELLGDCEFWAAKAAQQRPEAQAEISPGPPERADAGLHGRELEAGS